MNIRNVILSASGAAALLGTAIPGIAGPVPVLRAATAFAVLGASTVTSTGSTAITGDVGLYSGPSISGFALPPANTVVEGPGSTGLIDGAGLVTGTIRIADAVAQQAQTDLTKAYTALSLLPVSSNLSGQDLGSYHSGNLGALPPGVYRFDTSATITGTLQLDAQNTDGVYWVFQIGSTLTTADSDSVVQFVNANTAGNNGADVGVFWLIGTSATLGTGTTMEGNILAQDSITLTTSAQVLSGRALAQSGAVTMDTNTIRDISPLNNNGPGFSGGLVFASENSTTLVPIGSIPEPSALAILALGGAVLCSFGCRRKSAVGDC